MKKVLLFIGGFISGIVATLLTALLIGNANQPEADIDGLMLFPEKGDCITTSGNLKVMQVIAPNAALAWAGEILDPDRLLVLLINDDDKTYYDDQKIKIPNGKCARQIGTYQYTTRGGIDKTVPAIIIE